MATQAVKYDSQNDHSTQSTTDVPLVKTEKRTVTYESGGSKHDDLDPGILVSAQSHSSRTQTIETTTVSLSAAPSSLDHFSFPSPVSFSLSVPVTLFLFPQAGLEMPMDRNIDHSIQAERDYVI